MIMHSLLITCFKRPSSGGIQPLPVSTAALLDEAVTVDVVCGPTAAAFLIESLVLRI